MPPPLQKFLRAEWRQCLLIILPVLAVLLAQTQATQPVPMQWNWRGEVTWTAPPSWGLWIVPGCLLGTILLVLAFEHFDKNRQRTDGAPGLSAHGKAVRSVRLAISLGLFGITLLQIASACGHPLGVQRLLPVGIALLVAFFGNVFGKLKPNRYLGIRVPWTMNSEEVWRQTHRAAGYLWMGSGLLMALWAYAGPQTGMHWVLLGWFIILLVAPLGVAWRAVQAERANLTGNLR